MSVVYSRNPDQYMIITSVTMKTRQSQRDSADTNQFPILALTEKKQRYICFNFSSNFHLSFYTHQEEGPDFINGCFFPTA